MHTLVVMFGLLGTLFFATAAEAQAQPEITIARTGATWQPGLCADGSCQVNAAICAATSDADTLFTVIDFCEFSCILSQGLGEGVPVPGRVAAAMAAGTGGLAACPEICAGATAVGIYGSASSTKCVPTGTLP